MPFGDGDHPKHDLGKTAEVLDFVKAEAEMFRAMADGSWYTAFPPAPDGFEPDGDKASKYHDDTVTMAQYADFNRQAQQALKDGGDTGTPDPGPDPVTDPGTDTGAPSDGTTDAPTSDGGTPEGTDTATPDQPVNQGIATEDLKGDPNIS